MFLEGLKTPNIALHMAFARDRALLRRLWGSEGTATTVVALGLERSTHTRGEID